MFMCAAKRENVSDPEHEFFPELGLRVTKPELAEVARICAHPLACPEPVN
jgi:hypothetical protein